jgi:hypothetical protein
MGVFQPLRQHRKSDSFTSGKVNRRSGKMKKRLLILTLVGILAFIHPVRAQTWQKTQRLTWSFLRSAGANVDTDSSNNIHVVYFDNTVDAVDYEIYYKKSTDGSSNWSTKRLTWNSDNSLYVDIAVDISDNIHITWQDDSPGNAEIYYKKSTNNGTSWSSTKRLTNNSGDSRNPEISADSSGNIHLVWFDFSTGDTEIFYKKSTNWGNNWQATKRLTWNSGSSTNPALGLDSNGHIHVVWEDSTPGNSELYYKKSTNGGANWSKAKRLTWNSGISDTNAGCLGIDSNDYIHIVWSDNTPGNYEIYYKRSESGGNTWTSSKRLTWNSDDSAYPSVALDTNDDIHVVFHEGPMDGHEIFYKKSTNTGTTWISKRLSWNSGDSVFPDIAVYLGETIHVVWNDDTPMMDQIYYRKGIQ